MDAPNPSEGQFRALTIAACLLLGAIAYVNTFDGDWVWDDASSVLMHEHVHDPATFLELFREDQHAFGHKATGEQGNFYRPLVAASFMLDFALSFDPALDQPPGTRYPAVKPFVFHLSSLLWHLAAALLLLALLTRLGAPRLVRAAVPCIYVVHPLHTEAVAYISGRADMMSAAFMFAGLYFALYDGPPVRRIAAWLLSALCFCGGLLSKESSFIFPVLLALFCLIRPRTAAGETHASATAYPRPVTPLAAAAILFAIYAILRMTILKFAESAAAAESEMGERLLEACQAFAFYIRVLLWPTGLHMEQSLANAPAWTAGIGALLLALCAALLALSLLRKQHRIALAIAWFLAT